MITQKQLKEVLHYNPDTGIFVWIKSNRGLVSKEAGTLNGGYLRIKIDHKLYYAHVLAWFYVKGKWPEFEIDHKDRIKTHNWFSNLRDATKSVNQQNQTKARIDSTTGVRGVTKNKVSGRYHVQIMFDKKAIYLGSFSTLKIATGVVLRAKKKFHNVAMPD